MSDSILCPKCGGQTCVIDSRGKTDMVRRRRKCLTEPTHRFTTHETITDPRSSLKNRRRRFDMLMKALRKTL